MEQFSGDQESDSPEGGLIAKELHRKENFKYK